MPDIYEIFESLNAINDVISDEQLNFQNWLEEQREQNISDEEILKEINLAWGFKSQFKSIDEAETFFENLSI